MRDGKMHGWGTHTWADGTNGSLRGRVSRRQADGSGDLHLGQRQPLRGRLARRQADGGLSPGPTGPATRAIGATASGRVGGPSPGPAARYEGEYRDSKMHGRGTYTWADGQRYEGDWRDSKPHGQGTRIDPDGDRFAGQWRNGCFGKRGGTWAVLATTAEACGFE